MKYTYDYPRPMVTVDALLLSKSSTTEILLIQRKNDPFKGKWAIPGGFIGMDENLEIAAKRELFEETGIEINNLQQFRTYGKPGRDPRGRTISVVFIAYVDNTIPAKGMDDALQAHWFDVANLPELAFDHNQIIEDVLNYSSSYI